MGSDENLAIQAAVLFYLQLIVTFEKKTVTILSMQHKSLCRFKCWLDHLSFSCNATHAVTIYIECQHVIFLYLFPFYRDRLSLPQPVHVIL